MRKFFLLFINLWLLVGVFASAQVKRLLPGSVNTVKFTEYAPSISADGQTLVYETDRSGGQGGWELYQADLLDNASWSLPRPLTKINTYGSGKDLIGGPSISYDGNTLFFFAYLNSPDFKSHGREDIYYAVREKDGWSKPANLGPTINTAGYEGFPSISADGKRLYFMRGLFDMPSKLEDYTCYKIMMAERGRDGNWKRPIELPAPINLTCEKAPRIMADNRTLIFSSVRKGGKGDFDLYKSVLQDDGTWSEPVNLKFVNTRGLDQFVSIPPCGDIMYYTSGGDIYTVAVPEDLRPYRMASVQGFITDSLTGQPVVARVVAIDGQGQRSMSEMDNNASDGRYTLILETARQYALRIIHPDYQPKTIQLPSVALANCGTFIQNIKLTPLSRVQETAVASAAGIPESEPVQTPSTLAGATTPAQPTLASTPDSEPVATISQNRQPALVKAQPTPPESVVRVQAGKATVTFQAFDKETSKPIGATFQLTGLSTQRRLSVTTTPQRLAQTLTFTESDTLKIRTSADGYGEVGEPLWVGVATDGDTRYEYRAYLPPTLGATLLVNVRDAEVDRAVPGLKVILQDETTGQNRPLDYDPKTMTARTALDPTHRYTVAVEAPGYKPYSKGLDKVLDENEIGIQLPRKVQSRVTLSATDKLTQQPIGTTFKLSLVSAMQVFVVETKPGQEETFVFEKSGTYLIEASAPGYRPVKKEYVLTEKDLKAFAFKPALEPATTEFTFLVVDKDQRSVVPNATIRVFDENKIPVKVVNVSGESTVQLPDVGNFTYIATAAEYQTVTAPMERPASRLLEVGLIRQRTAPQTQTVAFIAWDAFTKKPIAARFRLIGAETSSTATVTTAASPQFGTELKLKQPYSLEVESKGYENYTQNITLDAPETEPIEPRIVLMEPLAYSVVFTVMDAVTMKNIEPTTLQVREGNKVLSLQKASSPMARTVDLAPDNDYEVRVSQPGYELFERTLTFAKPTNGNDLVKTILIMPVKPEPAPAAAPVPAPAPVAATPKVADETVFENLKIGEAVRLDNVYFDQSSYILRTESYPQLDKLVKTLKRNPRLKIEIAGHTDNVGDDRLNTSLSENRARVIASYFARQGIDRARLVSRGYGSAQPVSANDTEENKARNRRVEFVVVED